MALVRRVEEESGLSWTAVAAVALVVAAGVVAVIVARRRRTASPPKAPAARPAVEPRAAPVARPAEPAAPAPAPAPAPRPSGIFICYRRDDTQGYVRALHDALEAKLGAVPVFRDIDALKPGEDFVDTMRQTLASCDVILVVIGNHWLDARGADGGRRLSNDEDYVRMEVGTALAGDALVVPVLVQGAVMPAASDLPDDLKRLARKNALELSDSRWDYDVQRLVDVLTARLGTG